jgi:hypothetical protein
VINFVFSRAIHEKNYRNFVLTDQTASEVPKPEATIQQINISFNTEQDRLLLRVGLSDNTELLLWLTYRITRQLWQLLNGETHLPTADSIQADALPGQAVAQFKQEAQAAETLKKMDFATKYQPRKALRDEGALLAVKLALSGANIKHLNILCLEGVSVGVNLPPALILAVCNLLQISATKAGWSLGAKVEAQPLVNTDEASGGIADKNKVVH